MPILPAPPCLPDCRKPRPFVLWLKELLSEKIMTTINPEAELIAEKLGRTIDLLRAEINALRAAQVHDRELIDRRLSYLESQASDHEQRLRITGDGVTQFKVWSGLTSGGSGLLSLAAFLRTFFGG